MSTIANDDPEVAVMQQAPKSIPVVQFKKRRLKKRGVKQVNSPGAFSAPVNLMTTNTPTDDPIIIDDESVDDESNGSLSDGSDDGPIAHSIKQVLRHRQHHVERMKSSLDSLIAYVDSTADSDQSGDYYSVRVGEKRSFDDFVTTELDDSDQPKLSANDLINEIEKYQGMLRRTKAFQR